MENESRQDVQQQVNEEDRECLGKAETPPPTYDDACRLLMSSRTASQPTHVSLDPPPEYPDNVYNAIASPLRHQTQFVNVTTDQPDNQGYNGQNTIVISSNEDSPRTVGLCKKIAVYSVAIFWISISCIQLLLTVAGAQHYNFGRFLYITSNNDPLQIRRNAIFMFWMMTLFANIMLLSGIINKNR